MGSPRRVVEERRKCVETLLSGSWRTSGKQHQLHRTYIARKSDTLIRSSTTVLGNGQKKVTLRYTVNAPEIEL